MAWAISAGVLLLMAIGAGRLVRNQGQAGPSRLLGILIDDRGRYSLSRFQIALWSILVVSVVSSVFFGRLVGGSSADALDFRIPPELLGALGISVGSTTVAAAVKASKNATRPEAVAASGPQDPPRWTQMLLREEGDKADKIIDLAKLQNFWITLLLVGAYALLFGAAIKAADTAADLAIPGFSTTFLTLFGISHAGYLAGKLPNPTGVPDGLSLLGVERPDVVQENPQLADRAARTRNPATTPLGTSQTVAPAQAVGPEAGGPMR
jgi:hypothetical protein